MELYCRMGLVPRHAGTKSPGHAKTSVGICDSDGANGINGVCGSRVPIPKDRHEPVGFRGVSVQFGYEF